MTHNAKCLQVAKAYKKAYLNDFDDKSYNDFIKDITKVIVISFKTPILYQFITFYGETIIPYLLYFFNNKKLKNEARTLKKLKEIYMKQTERLIKDYIFCIERIT